MSEWPLGLMFDHDTRYLDVRDLDQSDVIADAREQEYLSTLTDEERLEYEETMREVEVIGSWMECPICKSEGAPFERQVIAEKTHGGFDPTVVYQLSCCHWIL